MQFKHAIAGVDASPRDGEHEDPDGRVNGILNTVAPGPEHDRRAAHEFGVQLRDEPCAWRLHDMALRRGRQARVIVDDARVATLVLDNLTESLKTCARIDGSAGARG